MKPQKISKIDVLKFTVLGVLVFVLIACQTINTDKTQSPTATLTLMPSPTATATVTPIPPTPTPAVQSITDVNAWRVQVRDEAMAAAGVSTWSEYIVQEVVGSGDFSVFESSSRDVGEPFTMIFVEGRVMTEPVWVDVSSDYLRETVGIKRVLVMPIAFEHTQSNDPNNTTYVEGPAIGLCGFETNEGFVATMGSFIDSGGRHETSKHHKLTTVDDFGTMVGRVVMFEVVQQSRRKSFEGVSNPVEVWQPKTQSNQMRWNMLSERQKEMIAQIAISPDNYLWQRAFDEFVVNIPSGWEAYGGDTKYGIGGLTYVLTTSSGDKWVLIVSAGDDISAYLDIQ